RGCSDEPVYTQATPEAADLDRDRQNSVFVKPFESSQPPLERSRSPDVAPADQLDAATDLLDNEHTQEQLLVIDGREPSPHARITVVALAQLGDDVGIEQKRHQSRTRRILAGGRLNSASIPTLGMSARCSFSVRRFFPPWTNTSRRILRCSSSMDTPRRAARCRSSLTTCASMFLTISWGIGPFDSIDIEGRQRPGPTSSPWHVHARCRSGFVRRRTETARRARRKANWIRRWSSSRTTEPTASGEAARASPLVETRCRSRRPSASARC